MRLPYLLWRLTPPGRAAYRAYVNYQRQGPWATPGPAPRTRQRREPAYHSRRARRARADAAVQATRQPSPLRVTRVTEIYRGGRRRVLDYGPDGQVARVHSTRSRAKDGLGRRPRARAR
jgi:hypothetical protein